MELVLLFPQAIGSSYQLQSFQNAFRQFLPVLQCEMFPIVVCENEDRNPLGQNQMVEEVISLIFVQWVDDEFFRTQIQHVTVR